MTKQAVAKKEAENAVAVFDSGEGDTGFENTQSDDFAIPFINLLQKGSPQVDEDSGNYIEGAKSGMFLDSSTNEVFNELVVVPCFYHRADVEWRERESGGGFIAQHPSGYAVQQGLEKDDRGRWPTGDGTYIVDTRYFFCLRVTEDGEATPCVLSFASTQTKKARNWLTRAGQIKVDTPAGKKAILHSQKWRVTSVGEQKDEYTWKGYKIDHIGPIDNKELWEAAKDARDMFAGTAANVAPPASNAADVDDEVPF